MLTHGKIWTAIDALASRYGLLPSGLAKRAGLDVTAFNPSKRVTKREARAQAQIRPKRESLHLPALIVVKANSAVRSVASFCV